MKEIQSAGGPLIALDRDHLHLWTGVFGKGFIGEASSFATDYEAAGHLTGGRAYPPCNISGITGVAAHGLLITLPNYTALLGFGEKNSAYIVQVQYCDADWDFDCVKRDYFDNADYDRTKDVQFSCKSCTYVLFDAAYAGYDVGEDCLSFDLDAGKYTLSTGIFKPDKKTCLILYSIIRMISSE